MDDRRFDSLAKMVGKGVSRRSIIKGLLGLGGSAVAGPVVTDEVDARQTGSRPTSNLFQPPTPPDPPTTTTTAAPCPVGEEQCPNSTLCCPVDTCARSGNRAICCNGTESNGAIVCGLDCCDTDDQCCDGECCPDEMVCLARVFGDGPFVEEEVCCPIDLACRDILTGEGLCCDGECFEPEGGSIGIAQVLNPDFSCCPAGGTVCEGGDETLCCQGETPNCCIRGEEQRVICLTDAQCCVDEDCPGECSACNPQTNTCEDADVLCTDACKVCNAGQCVSECLSTEACCERRVGTEDVSVCIDPTQQCCNPTDCAGLNPGTERRCWFCRPNQDFTCDPVPNGDPCRGGGPEGVCCDGVCCDTGEICQEVEGEIGISQTASCVAPTTTTTTTAAPTTTTTAVPTTSTAPPITCDPSNPDCPEDLECCDNGICGGAAFEECGPGVQCCDALVCATLTTGGHNEALCLDAAACAVTGCPDDQVCDFRTLSCASCATEESLCDENADCCSGCCVPNQFLNGAKTCVDAAVCSTATTTAAPTTTTSAPTGTTPVPVTTTEAPTSTTADPCAGVTCTAIEICVDGACCREISQFCADDFQCCSGRCNFATGVAPVCEPCLGGGEFCVRRGDCCSGSCVASRCVSVAPTTTTPGPGVTTTTGTPTITTTMAPAPGTTTTADPCQGITCEPFDLCVNGACCRRNAQACATNTQCCSGRCNNFQVCQLCASGGEFCSEQSDCCSGNCEGSQCAPECDTANGLVSCTPLNICIDPDNQCCEAADCATLGNFADGCLGIRPDTLVETNICLCVNGACSPSAECAGPGGLCLLDDQCCGDTTCEGVVDTGGSPIFGACRAPGCIELNQVCFINENCCSGRCEGTSFGICVPCWANGGSCDEDSDCCSGWCDLTLAAPICISCLANTQSCDENIDCCSGSCRGFNCHPCLDDGHPCEEDSDCCTGDCRSAVPFTEQQWCGCAPADAACDQSSDCCSGNCNLGFCVGAGINSLTIQTTEEECIPATCESLGLSCGTADDGCRGTVDCGTCEEECIPATCESLGLGCGTADDGCGNLLDCGECCEPLGCADLGIACGPGTDNCGNAIDCGACPEEVTTPAPVVEETVIEDTVTCTALNDRCVNDEQCCEGLCRGRECRDRGTKICQVGCET